MDPAFSDACKQILPKTYVSQAENARRASQNAINDLMQHRRIPAQGLDDHVIERLLSDLADMDSNNFHGNCGAGEREGRVFSRIVADRHYRLSHGIGRSGELLSVQPKAAGSSIVAKLANCLALDALRMAGATHVADCFVVPMATGMTLCLTFLALRYIRPTAKFIIWPRVDQKSCYKSMVTAGFIPIVVENVMVGEELHCDVDDVDRKLRELGVGNVLCIHCTTSCFAPRAPDDLPALALICKKHDVPLIVNNAYGTQSSKCMHLLEEAARVGRVDAFVQSLDKNYMVPVGGSLLASYDSEFSLRISKVYPGLSLSKLDADKCTLLGSMLFIRNVSGARVVAPGAPQNVEGRTFQSFGQHTDFYPFPYLTLAVSIGMKNSEVDTVIARLSATLSKLLQQRLSEISAES